MGDVDETSTKGVSRSKINSNNNDNEMYIITAHFNLDSMKLYELAHVPYFKTHHM